MICLLNARESVIYIAVMFNERMVTLCEQTSIFTRYAILYACYAS